MGKAKKPQTDHANTNQDQERSEYSTEVWTASDANELHSGVIAQAEGRDEQSSQKGDSPADVRPKGMDA